MVVRTSKACFSVRIGFRSGIGSGFGLVGLVGGRLWVRHLSWRLMADRATCAETEMLKEPVNC